MVYSLVNWSIRAAKAIRMANAVKMNRMVTNGLFLGNGVDTVKSFQLFLFGLIASLDGHHQSGEHQSATNVFQRNKAEDSGHQQGGQCAKAKNLCGVQSSFCIHLFPFKLWKEYTTATRNGNGIL